MKGSSIAFLLLIFCTGCGKSPANFSEEGKDGDYVVIIKPCFKGDRISTEWQDALKTRQPKEYLDSLEQVVRPLTQEEQEWQQLIESRTPFWNKIKDSLHVPFGNHYIKDTTYIYLGFLGRDDGFTYKDQTVCFDLTALYHAYGSAKDSVNTNRMDRLFAHEYTHLLSKEWARRNNLQLRTYQDSILWECIYEGLGMYRSMSAKWWPVGDSLSAGAAPVMDKLYPVFTERITAILTAKDLSLEEKVSLHQNLSRGPMNRKWGALPVGVWLAMEAKGDDSKLKQWVDKGPKAVLLLAEKHLPPEHGSGIRKTLDRYQNP